MATLAIGIFLAQAPTAFDGYRPFEPILILLTFGQFYMAFRLRRRSEVESDPTRPAQTRYGTVVSWTVMLFVVAAGIYALLYFQGVQNGGAGQLYGYAAIASGAIAILLAFVRRVW
jgi:hypothetical protein